MGGYPGYAAGSKVAIDPFGQTVSFTGRLHGRANTTVGLSVRMGAGLDPETGFEPGVATGYKGTDPGAGLDDHVQLSVSVGAARYDRLLASLAASMSRPEFRFTIDLRTDSIHDDACALPTSPETVHHVGLRFSTGTVPGWA